MCADHSEKRQDTMSEDENDGSNGGRFIFDARFKNGAAELRVSLSKEEHAVLMRLRLEGEYTSYRELIVTLAREKLEESDENNSEI